MGESDQHSNGEKTEATTRRGFFVEAWKAVKIAGGVGAVAGLSEACDAKVLGKEYCASPNKIEASLIHEIELSGDLNERLTERQKQYILRAVHEVLVKIEGRFLQGVSRVEITSPELGEDCNCGGRYTDWNDTIRIVGPTVEEKQPGMKPQNIDLYSFLYNVEKRIMHELGHHVDLTLGGLSDKFDSYPPTLYQLYGRGRSDFGGGNAQNEDAAEAFRLYHDNSFSFPLFFFDEDSVNQKKYEALRDDLFCGKQPGMTDPLCSVRELLDLFKFKYGEFDSNLYQKLKGKEPLVGEDKVFRAYYDFALLLFSQNDPTIDHDETTRLYSMAKLSAGVIGSSIWYAQLDREYAQIVYVKFLVPLPRGFSEDSVKIKTLNLETAGKYISALNAEILPEYQKIVTREDLAKVYKDMGDKDKAIAILQKNIDEFPETADAERARVFIQNIND